MQTINHSKEIWDSSRDHTQPLMLSVTVCVRLKQDWPTHLTYFYVSLALKNSLLMLFYRSEQTTPHRWHFWMPFFLNVYVSLSLLQVNNVKQSCSLIAANVYCGLYIKHDTAKSYQQTLFDHHKVYIAILCGWINILYMSIASGVQRQSWWLCCL